MVQETRKGTEDPAVKGGQIGGQRSVEPGYGEVSAAEVEQYIKGIDFPADKQAVVQKMKENGAPEEVLELAEQFPEMQYETAVDVAKGVSEAKAH